MISLDISHDEKRDMLSRSLCGEMTVRLHTDDNKTELDTSAELDMIQAVATAMNLSSKAEVTDLKEVLFPCLMCSAVYKNNFNIIETCFKECANISAGDYDMRTPLHIAASEGNLDMTKFLLERGALVHKKDRNNDTPLVCAVSSGHIDVVRHLVSVGAHLTWPPAAVAEKLCQAAKTGDLNTILCWLAAGADLNVTDVSGATCLDKALAAGQHDLVETLRREAETKYR